MTQNGPQQGADIHRCGSFLDTDSEESKLMTLAKILQSTGKKK